jgi:hypothetical protein
MMQNASESVEASLTRFVPMTILRGWLTDRDDDGRWNNLKSGIMALLRRARFP